MGTPGIQDFALSENSKGCGVADVYVNVQESALSRSA